MKVGDKVKFSSEKQRYTVQACNERYAVCNKPMNALNTVLYTIIDPVEGIRGPEDLVFCMGAETRNLCEEMLARIVAGKSEISFRHRAPLDIERVDEFAAIPATEKEK